MSVFKPFITPDITVVPFKVNKTFTFEGGTELLSPNVGIDRYIGTNSQEKLFISGSNPTGNINSYNSGLIYQSIKQLYYSNYLLNKNGSPIFTSSIDTDGVRRGEGGTQQPSYYNYNTDTLPANRLFPTSPNDRIGVISIPNQLIGEYIKPGTLKIIYSGSFIQGEIIDDENGNLISDGSKIGDIIYQHGLLILTSFGTSITGSTYGTSLYGIGQYGTAGAQELDTIINTDNITCSFQSTLTIFESQYKCTLRENEYNFTQNPTIVSKSLDGSVYDYATGSFFQPYITTVGLYNNNKELIAVGKLSQPLQTSNTTDTTIIINLDL